MVHAIEAYASANANNNPISRTLALQALRLMGGSLLDAVRDDSPASKAGLKAGDKIVKLAGRDIKNVYDYTYALGEMKPDQEYEVEVARGGERLKMKLTPQARR